jgi:oligopeptide/dipeptide ABC transporter ATP-binding protein
MLESSVHPLLDVRELSVTLAPREGRLVHAVRSFSLVVERGSCVALVGESGAGKSMLARALLDLLPSNASHSGHVFLDGVDISTLSRTERRALNGSRIGLVFQEPLAALDPVFSIGEHLVETIVTHQHVSRREAVADALSLLERVGLVPGQAFLRRHSNTLSGGERQRALIAIATSCSPILLVADEPTTALDPTTEHEILTLLDGERARSGAAMLFITHDLAIARERADDVVVMFAGTVVENGPVGVVLDSPRHPYTRALLDASTMGRRRDAAGEPLLLHASAVRSTDEGAPDVGCVYRTRCAQASDRCLTSPALVATDAEKRAVACHHPLAHSVHDLVRMGAP